MPGSMLNALPGSSGSSVARDEVRILVGFEPDAVAGAVDEPVAEPARRDDPASGRVDRPRTSCPTVAARTACSCASTRTRVHVTHLGGRLAHHEHRA